MSLAERKITHYLVLMSELDTEYELKNRECSSQFYAKTTSLLDGTIVSEMEWDTDCTIKRYDRVGSLE